MEFSARTVLNVVGLWVMHVVVTLVTVVMASRVLPLSEQRS